MSLVLMLPSRDGVVLASDSNAIDEGGRIQAHAPKLQVEGSFGFGLSGINSLDDPEYDPAEFAWTFWRRQSYRITRESVEEFVQALRDYCIESPARAAFIEAPIAGVRGSVSLLLAAAYAPDDFAAGIVRVYTEERRFHTVTDYLPLTPESLPAFRAIGRTTEAKDAAQRLITANYFAGMTRVADVPAALASAFLTQTVLDAAAGHAFVGGAIATTLIRPPAPPTILPLSEGSPLSV